jgi:DNA-binding NtrC family response regulator
MTDEKTVLIVDDEACFREFAAGALSEGGFLTSVAGDGHEAIRSLEMMPFDMAVVDILMPEKEGLETIMEIKRRWPGCTVVAMAGDERVPAHRYLGMASRLGADALLTKPFSAQAVLETVHAAFAAPNAAPARAA